MPFVGFHVNNVILCPCLIQQVSFFNLIALPLFRAWCKTFPECMSLQTQVRRAGGVRLLWRAVATAAAIRCRASQFDGGAAVHLLIIAQKVLRAARGCDARSAAIDTCR